MTSARDAGGAATEAMVEDVVRGILRASGCELLADECWPDEIARHRELAERFGKTYLNSSSLIARTFREARIALTAALALGPAQPDAAAMREEVGRLRALVDKASAAPWANMDTIAPELALPGLSDPIQAVMTAIGAGRSAPEGERGRDFVLEHMMHAVRRVQDLQHRLTASDRALAEARAERDAARAGKVHRTREREKHGVRLAIAYLHRRAADMVDPHAKAVLNGAAFGLGCALVAKLDLEHEGSAQADLRAENDRLRALLATSDAPCPYCALPADRMAECASGFPGCARADDMGAAATGLADASIERALAAVAKRDDLAPDPGPGTAGASTGGGDGE